VARQRLAAGQGELDLGLDDSPDAGGPLQITGAQPEESCAPVAPTGALEHTQRGGRRWSGVGTRARDPPTWPGPGRREAPVRNLN